MKKSILTISLLFFTIIVTRAQLPFTFDLGLKAGINSSKITTDNLSFNGYNYNDFKSDVKSGYNIGAFARIGSKSVYLQPELLYCKRNGETTSGTVSQTLSLKTIQVPVLLGVKILDMKLASIRAFTGPAMSFVSNSSLINLSLPGFDPKNFKSNIWDWQLGAGLDVLKFTFDVRYEWGLTNISEKNITNIGFVNKGNMLTFSVGFKFI